ncbi:MULTISPECIES: hypothetical protein [Pantoea]|jgi:uncharacterized lipoprotein YmbA|uniref:hypothetical protein n=1 Tax=Pantoea TaxID=53335 RepID=UPI0001E59B7D|nr:MULTISPECIES: hypothetical protein [Pantoea]ADO09028.1 hypothetical protein Pvag_0831 [Pantoea vagans C9-1]MBK5013780.1 hypothetical protein [Pantoea sp. S62]MCJ7925503.1 hypothetical protein [Pantoea vagans]MCX3309375.1 hypothetical protein [Pantoea vagans]PAW37001.1 hypothetical protein CIL06_15325 [Pantoea vagans]
MNKNTFFTLVVAAVLLTGCARTAPIHNVNQTLTQRYTDNQMKLAIIEAGIGRKWVMTPVSPGVINGRLAQRDFVATIRITYTSQNYRIDYVSSENLKAGQGEIHNNYNRWIANLDQDIQLRLSALAAQ